MTAFNPALCARLVAQLRDRYARCGAVSTADALDLADQLEAALAENAKLREVAIAAGTIRNMRFAVDSRLKREERSVFNSLSVAWDAWKFPQAKP